MIIRELLVKLGVKADMAGLKRFESGLSGVKQVATTAAKGLAILTGSAAAAGAGLYKLTKGVADTAEEISKASSKTGVSTDLLQELKFAAGKAGVPFESLTRGMRKFGIAAGNAVHGNKAAKAAFVSLGVSLRDSVTGKLKTTDQLLTESMLAMANMKEQGLDPMVQSQKLFGMGAQAMLPLLDEGAGGFAELLLKAREANKVIGKDGIKAGAGMAKQLRTLESTAEGLKTTLATALMPAVGEIVGKIATWVNANKKLVNQKIAELAKSISAALKELWSAVERGHVLETLTGILKGVAEAFSWVLRHGTAVKWLLYTLAGAAILGKISPLVGLVKTLASNMLGVATGGSGASAAVGGLVGKLGLLAAAAAGGYALGTWLDDLTGASNGLSEALMGPARKLSEIKMAAYEKVANVDSILKQGQMYGDMMARGAKSVTVEGGIQMALNRENIMGRLARQASALGISSDVQSSLLPAAMERAGNPASGAVTNTIAPVLNISLAPGTPERVAKQIASQAGALTQKELRNAARSVQR